MRLYEPSVLDQIVLALIGERPRHGFAVSKELETDPSLSAVIRARRPLVYRSINSLVEAKLIREIKTEPGDQGSPRVIYAATATGKSTITKWLNDTVDHPRDARIELLAKFVLRNRRKLSSKQLATRQRKLFVRQAANLQVDAISATSDVRLVALWRVENINAMIRLLDAVILDAVILDTVINE
jgi:DNA-binding PadR family transcriptional regulator